MARSTVATAAPPKPPAAPATSSPAGAARPVRSDARRNRDKLLAAAAEAFTGSDATEVSLEGIARAAGVGIGTLYRHFPTRAALIEAVYRNEVELLCASVDELLADHPADEALGLWMERFIGYAAVKRGLITAMRALLVADTQTFAHCRALVDDGMRRLVDAAVEAGSICPHTDPDDLLRALSGFCMSGEQSGWQDRATRLVALLIDGLRYRAPAT